MTKNIATNRQLKVTEVLDLRLLPDEGLRFDEPLEIAWLDEQLEEIGEDDATAVRANGPGRAKLDVEPLGPVASRPPIRVHGAIHADLAMTCVRCLQPVSQKAEAAVDVTLFPKREGEGPATREEEDELAAEQLDEGTYEENVLDLPEIVREALLLEVAMNPSCEDEAACTERTESMLREANRAAEKVLDDRWAPLRQLINASGNNEKN